MLYTFDLPTTGSITLAQCFRTDHHQLLVNGDGARTTMRDTLKRAKRDDKPDYLAVVKAIEEYLPYLYTINEQIQQQQMDTIDFRASWRMPSARTIDSRVEVASVEFERGMVLLTYSLAMVDLANEAVKRTDNEDTKWKLASSYLLKAESVLTHLNAHPVNIDRVPEDLQSTTVTGLISLCQGMSHLLILLKSADSSPSLLSRVSIYAAERIRAAQNLKIDSDLTKWMQVAHAYCIASTQRYMAMDRSAKNKVGEAIAYLQAAETTLSVPPPATASSSTNKKIPALSHQFKHNPMISALRTTIHELAEDYKAENDRLAFQEVPKVADLPRDWPSGRPVTTVTQPWQPPRSLVNSLSSSSAQETYSGSQYF